RQLGDAKAMDLLRNHNGIVREALKAYHGNEVKHTGDGFMVSFASVSRAVECAVAILKAFEAYNRENPDMPIHLKIGLSAGEPIEENQDFFSSAPACNSRRACAAARRPTRF